MSRKADDVFARERSPAVAVVPARDPYGVGPTATLVFVRSIRDITPTLCSVQPGVASSP
ncbi:unnamed protein product [Ectocarpus sp. CCAP 1310/34]|nr:unnamed protein product [Ectocarpus sp. CCAP 1310/34]